MSILSNKISRQIGLENRRWDRFEMVGFTSNPDQEVASRCWRSIALLKSEIDHVSQSHSNSSVGHPYFIRSDDINNGRPENLPVCWVLYVSGRESTQAASVDKELARKDIVMDLKRNRALRRYSCRCRPWAKRRRDNRPRVVCKTGSLPGTCNSLREARMTFENQLAHSGLQTVS